VESDLPSTLDPATIYAITDSEETMIEKLVIRGMEFVGGGGDDGEPKMLSPRDGTTLNLGENAGSGIADYPLSVKAKNLDFGGSTVGLTIEASGTGLSFSHGQQTGLTTVTLAQTSGVVNDTILLNFSGSGALDDGQLEFKHGNDTLATVDVRVTVPMVQLRGVKFNGSQWLKTDYVPNNNTALEINFKMTATSLTVMSSDRFFMRTAANGNNNFLIFPFGDSTTTEKWGVIIGTDASTIVNSNVIASQYFFADNAKITLQNGVCTFIANGQSFQIAANVTIPALRDPITICGRIKDGAELIYNFTDVALYGFKIWENGTLVRDYTPVMRGGVVGMYDNITGAFIHSESSTSLIAITE
jgi:hypothetical protein